MHGQCLSEPLHSCIATERDMTESKYIIFQNCLKTLAILIIDVESV